MNGVYYLFDCLDGDLGDKFLTLEELHDLMTKDPRPFTERDAIRIARNYEADLYRYTYVNGEKKEVKQLVDLSF